MVLRSAPSTGRTALTVSLVLSAASVCSRAQVLGDFNTRAAAPGSSAPGGAAQRGDDVFFSAATPLAGRELWVADRTRGARLVADVVPGALGSGPASITPWGQSIAFLGDLGGGQRPMVVDLNTRSVGSILTATGALSSVARLTVSGTSLFFVASDPMSGADLWVVPQPGARAQPVADLRTGLPPAFAAMVPFGNGVAMILDDGVHGYELWVSDGTAAGTRLVRDLNPGTAWGAYNREPVVFGGELYFVGDDGATGAELYAFDGTSIRLVADVRSGPAGSFPDRLTVAGNRLVCVANDGVIVGYRPVVSDGTAAGTQLVAGVGAVSNVVADAAGRIYALTFSTPRDLAVIDVGSNSARLLGLSLDVSGLVTPPMTAAGARVYFEVSAGRTTRGQFWTSDGTSAGTRLLLETSAIGMSFTASYADGVVLASLTTDADGRELWISDGTVAGTRLFADLDPSRPTGDSQPTALGEVAGRAIVSLIEGSSRQLIGTDGSLRNTGVLRSLTATSTWTEVARIDDALLLFETSNGSRLLRTDGTPAGTFEIASVGRSNSQPGGARLGIELDGGRAVFAGSVDGVVGQLWVTDGTAAGTRMLRSFAQVAPYGFAKVGAEVWFFGGAGSVRVDLWATDGTVAGTRMLTPVPQSTQPPTMFGSAGGKVVFATSDRQTGYEPWVSDGTAAGTQLLLDLTPGSPGSFFYSALDNGTAIGDRVLLRAVGGVVATDGTPAGTVVLPGTLGDERVIGMGDYAYVSRVATPISLLRTDGTLAGTSTVPVTWPAGTAPLRRISDNLLALSVRNSTGDGSLLVSDGTAVGTRVLATNYRTFPIGVVDGGVVYAGSDLRFGVEPHFASVGATSHVDGRGCGLGAVPSLRASEPRLGQTMVVRGARLGAASLVMFGAPAFTPLRLSLPASGCSLFLADLAVAVAMPSAGELRVAVPFGFDLIGARIAAQLVSVDAAASVALSNGVRLTPGL